MQNSSTFGGDGRANAGVTDGKKRQRREQYLDRLMHENVSRRTGLLMQLGRKRDVDGTESTDPVVEKAGQEEMSPARQAARYPQKAVARVRNLEPFGALGNGTGPEVSRLLVPEIHKGRPAGRYLQLEVNDGLLAGESNGHHTLRDAAHPAMRSNGRPPGHKASPPSLIAGAVQAIEANRREMHSLGKGVSHRGPAHRSPDVAFKHLVGEGLPSGIKTQILEPP